VTTLRMAVIAAASAAAIMALVLLISRDEGGSQLAQGSEQVELPPRGAPTATRLAALRAAVRAQPDVVAGHVLLAATELQWVRETGDPSGYVRADREIARALALRPDDQGARTERAQLELARHRFRAALRDAEDARRADPSVVRPYGALVDANVELGRYRAANRALQEMLDRKPEYAGFTRLSYVRELHGDLPGALDALQAALSAGGGTGESTAFAASLAGNLELQRGHVALARRHYREARAAFPASGPAKLGLARVDAARGRLGPAIRRLRALVGPRRGSAGDLLPLVELELAAGCRSAAQGHLARARAHQLLETRSGVDVRVERALLEADHGDPRSALALARQGLRGAPTGVRAQHALGWALTRADRPEEGLRWARRSLRLGWRDPLPVLHAGLAAAAAGEPQLAQRWLRQARRGRAWLGPWQTAKATHALGSDLASGRVRGCKI
jgi:tetratricopeptide (TPR) repeat protein